GGNNCATQGSHEDLLQRGQIPGGPGGRCLLMKHVQDARADQEDPGQNNQATAAATRRPGPVGPPRPGGSARAIPITTTEEGIRSTAHARHSLGRTKKGKG